MVTASGTHFMPTGGPACLEGDMHSCPIPGHGTTPIVSGCSTTTSQNGTPVAIAGSVARCGAVLDSAFAPNWELT
jgi:uncharacterized Zn-binding protein involved in type VI secretion